MTQWTSISQKALRSRVEQGVARMTPGQARFWEAIRIPPEKWEQLPYGRDGGGFWVVAVIGRTVIWYNDIEDGFNRSRYTVHGRIDDYWCNQDELEVAIGTLMSMIERGGPDLVLIRKPRRQIGR